MGKTCPGTPWAVQLSSADKLQASLVAAWRPRLKYWYLLPLQDRPDHSC